MDRTTARKYIAAGTLPSAMAKPHDWRTRPDPFEEHRPEVEALPRARFDRATRARPRR